jgi:hypothetical protein
MWKRRNGGMKIGRRTWPEPDTRIELSPVEVEMLEVLLGTIVQTGGASIDTQFGLPVINEPGTILR